MSGSVIVFFFRERAAPCRPERVGFACNGSTPSKDKVAQQMLEHGDVVEREGGEGTHTCIQGFELRLPPVDVAV